MVSPVDKLGGDVGPWATETRAAADGNAIQYSSLQGFADVRGMGVMSQYIARRDANAGQWLTHAITPEQESQGGSWLIRNIAPQYLHEFSSDLSVGVFRSISPLTDAPNVANLLNIYRRDDLLGPGSGSYDLLNDCPPPPVGLCTAPFPPLQTMVDQANRTPVNAQPKFKSASEDFSKVLFTSNLNLAPGATGGQEKLYEWTGGFPRLAGILPGPDPDGDGPLSGPPAMCGTETCSMTGLNTAQLGQTANSYYHHTISDDGRRVVFLSPGGSDSELYLRDDLGNVDPADDVSVHVSASERTDCATQPPDCGGDNVPDPDPEPGAAGAILWDTAGTDPTGRRNATKVFFSSSKQLTDEGTDGEGGIYVYDATKPPSDPDNLTLIGNGDGILGTSDHGSTVYFAGRRQLVPDGPRCGDDGVYCIFVWHEGDTRFVGLDRHTGTAALPSYQENVPHSATTEKKLSRVTPTGSHLLFAALEGDGLTGYDHGGSCGIGGESPCRQIYLYQREPEKLVCVSCDPTGAPATGAADIVTEADSSNYVRSANLNQALSDDGRFVFFSTAGQLVPGDSNGPCQVGGLNGNGPCVDVYAYDSEEGEVSLISSGKDSNGSYFLDASADGSNVFFTTRETLVSQDVDGRANDLYTARIGGGFAQQNPPSSPSACSGDACQGDSADPPAVGRPGSTGVGRGNPPVGKRVSLSLGKLRLTQRRKAARRGTLRLSVRTSSVGRIHAIARGEIAGRARAVGSDVVSVRKPGAVKLSLRLSRAARRWLRAERALRLTVRVTQGDARPRSTTVVLRRRK